MALEFTYNLFEHQQKHHPNDKAIVCRRNGNWKSYSTNEILSEINQIIIFLKLKGINRNDKVILLPGAATAKFIFFDLAIQTIGAITVMVHKTMNKQQFEIIKLETEARLIIFDNQESKNNLISESQAGSNLLLIDEIDYMRFSQTEIENEYISDVKKTSSIIYTSGTTGIPKGVMLSHENIMSNVNAMVPLIPINDKSKIISFLPYSHAFERTGIFSYIVAGASIHLIDKIDYLPKALLEIKPHLFTAVPRIIEKMYNEVFVYRSKKSSAAKWIIDWSLKAGIKHYETGGFKPLAWLKLLILRTTVFRKFKKKLGGNLKVIVVGAAHLNDNIAKIFAAANIPIREGYGLTEASPVITVNRMQKGLHKLGTVGLPLPGIEIRLENKNKNGEGEILVKGKNIMQGYFLKPEETKLVLNKDGWLKTGDIGKIVKKRFLKITDRKKDIFKTSSGKYIAPQELENHFKASEYIEQIIILGFQKPYVTSLIFPNYTLLKEWAKREEIHWTAPQYMALNIKVHQKIKEEIDTFNKTLPGHKRVKDFHLIYEDFSIENGQLSNTLKPIRKAIKNHYLKDIEQLYSKS